jgi:AAA+ superfamily predicted ATPase
MATLVNNLLPTVKPLPDALTLEKRSNCLASLSLDREISDYLGSVVQQWRRMSDFGDLAKYGIAATRLMLFYGPPGNGKTSAAGRLAAELDWPLYRVRCESLIGSLVGESLRSMANVMTFLQTPKPAVVLFDEAETILVNRSMSGNSLGSQENSRMQTIFWQYLDRWESPQIFILATNMEERLDPAIMSRVEASLCFSAPTADQVAAVVDYWCEVFHEYSPQLWRDKLAASEPVSFRELWRAIKSEVRSVVLAR